MKYWFAVEIDRDYKTHSYGNGVRLYLDSSTNYTIVQGISYENNILTLKDATGKIIVLNKEPNNLLFENSVHNDWVKWDKKYGECYEQNRNDYEPWAFNSLKALAFEFNLYKLRPGEILNNYFKKPY